MEQYTRLESPSLDHIKEMLFDSHMDLFILKKTSVSSCVFVCVCVCVCGGGGGMGVWVCGCVSMMVVVLMLKIVIMAMMMTMTRKVTTTTVMIQVCKVEQAMCRYNDCSECVSDPHCGWCVNAKKKCLTLFCYK